MASGTLVVSTPSDREIRMVRVFNAPRRPVFDALTRPASMKRWFAPPGWTMATCEFDARVGGAYRYVWRKDDGTEMGMGGTLIEFVPPERMTTSEKFDQPWYPGEAQGTIVLTEGGNKTTLTLTVRYDSKEVRDSILRSPMAEGVSSGYDNLAAWLDSDDARQA